MWSNGLPSSFPLDLVLPSKGKGRDGPYGAPPKGKGKMQSEPLEGRRPLAFTSSSSTAADSEAETAAQLEDLTPSSAPRSTEVDISPRVREGQVVATMLARARAAHREVVQLAAERRASEADAGGNDLEGGAFGDEDGDSDDSLDSRALSVLEESWQAQRG